MWNDIKTAITAIMSAIVAAARTTEKSVGLIEAEVDNLRDYQNIRLTENKQELQQLEQKLLS